MANLIETARLYVVANGGHATVAASISVPTVHLVEVCAGLRPMSPQAAAGLAPLIGVAVPQLLAADPDYQLMARRGVRP
jgi:hypothetical protein